MYTRSSAAGKLKKSVSIIEVKVEAQVTRINTHFSAFTSTLACSLSLTASLPAEKRALDFGELPSTGSRPELVEGSRAARRGWVGETSGLFDHPGVILTGTRY